MIQNILKKINTTKFGHLRPKILEQDQEVEIPKALNKNLDENSLRGIKQRGKKFFKNKIKIQVNY